MSNRLFYTVKLSSKDLKENKYKINRTFNKCLENGWIISLADSQVLRSIRDITNKKIDRDLLENWYKERDRLKKKKNSQDNRNRIKELQQQIYDMMYIPEYITVQMETKADYQKIYKNGFIFNGKEYRRFSCSASQARVSTIVFISIDIKDELKRRLDNGRDLNHPLAPSKYNAYFGLYSSAIKEVTKPRFCIVPDYNSTISVDVDFINETDKNSDDIIEPKTMNIEFNRFDGSGLISPRMAEQWGKDLGEDYTPCQFCLRYSFTKGMVNEFDFVEWCKEENDENYIIQDVWGKDIDLREIDVILSEGQVKLWDSWKSQKDFEYNSEKNGIVFGITKYTPKQDKDVLTTNYQFLQTLNLNKQDIEDICQETVKYIKGVSYNDIYYSLLFMMGENMDVIDIKKYMQTHDDYWLKSLILNHSLFNDKYSKEKIRSMIIKRIELACLGKIIVNGNFQVIVPDSFAYMQWITGQKVTGLLKEGEFYSMYWEKLNKNRIACARSPMTHFSEWYIAKNKYKNDDKDIIDKIHKYFQYDYSGIITNIHGSYTMNFSGSDFDMDILATTSNEQILNNKYPDQRVVTYKPKKPKKIIFTEDDLYKADTFSFGTKIGNITNFSTSFCAMLSTFPEGSKERKLIEDRIKMCCGSQSRQIDKTKIGQAVKDIPSIWKTYQKIKDDDTNEEKEKKKFYNSLLADKKPYFFRYKYEKINKGCNGKDQLTKENSDSFLAIPLKELKKMPEKELTTKQKEFLEESKKYRVIDSDCVMNNLCHYIESIDFDIKKRIKNSDGFDYRILLSNNNFNINKKIYNKLEKTMQESFKIWEMKKSKEKKGQIIRGNTTRPSSEKIFNKEIEYDLLREKLEDICSNEESLVNHLVYMFYVDHLSYSKSILWSLVGKSIYENVKEKNKNFYFPIKNKNGSINFLYNNYSIEKISLEEEEKYND